MLHELELQREAEVEAQKRKEVMQSFAQTRADNLAKLKLICINGLAVYFFVFIAMNCDGCRMAMHQFSNLWFCNNI